MRSQWGRYDLPRTIINDGFSIGDVENSLVDVENNQPWRNLCGILESNLQSWWIFSKRLRLSVFEYGWDLKMEDSGDSLDLQLHLFHQN